MSTITWLMLCAAFLPMVAAVVAKAGGKGFDNDAPRAWLSSQEGWRARANAAQANLFEGLPFFYAAVLLALFKQADPAWVAGLMLAWVLVRLVYIGLYIAGYGMLRTVVWALALALNVAILFA
ncbi:MAPEG family protein [Parapusillimonas granuli]|uniref:MAPEG family protein n=1 Tax=Parapusillimonas granuli TaxID=380911 RepID=A0A853FR48_9BURK|nr:MAPEG family protein [Parapusillimonas granuli]MBB5213465.1 putative MAPEG superfamily protein [Parapusillimonas granuli]MEB2398558.1 MAPEG family protein [Alcaligenaceae bacterium]NYT48304.1 MAPEG family protein [Parapusillimonas granuli]